MPEMEMEFKETIREIWDESSYSYDSFHGYGIKSKEERDAWKQTFEDGSAKKTSLKFWMWAAAQER